MKYLYAYERKFYHNLPDEVSPVETDPSLFKKQFSSRGNNQAHEGNNTNSSFNSSLSTNEREDGNEYSREMNGVLIVNGVISKGQPKHIVTLTSNPTVIQLNETQRGPNTFRSAYYNRTSTPNQPKLMNDQVYYLLKNIVYLFESNIASQIENGIDSLIAITHNNDLSIKFNSNLIHFLLQYLTNYLNKNNLDENEILFIDKILVILINLSFVSNNISYLITNTDIVNTILPIFISNNDSFHSQFALQIICNLSPVLLLDNSNYDLISFILGYLYNEDLASVTIAIQSLSNLSSISQNSFYISKLDNSILQRVQQLLFFNSQDCVFYALQFLENLIQFNSNHFDIQNTIGIKNLMLLLQKGISQEDSSSKETTRKIVSVLYNFIMNEPKSLLFLYPYCTFLYDLLSTINDPGLTSKIYEICIELNTNIQI